MARKRLIPMVVGPVERVAARISLLRERANRDAAIITYIRGGESLADVGRRYGVSRERIRQIAEREGVETSQLKQFKQGARAEFAAWRAYDRLFLLLQLQKKCPVCGRLVLRFHRGEPAVTCCGHCRWKYQGSCVYRMRDPVKRQRHRLAMARGIWRAREKRNPVQVRWAGRLLGEKDLPPIRNPGSARSMKAWWKKRKAEGEVKHVRRRRLRTEPG